MEETASKKWTGSPTVKKQQQIIIIGHLKKLNNQYSRTNTTYDGVPVAVVKVGMISYHRAWLVS